MLPAERSLALLSLLCASALLLYIYADGAPRASAPPASAFCPDVLCARATPPATHACRTSTTCLYPSNSSCAYTCRGDAAALARCFAAPGDDVATVWRACARSVPPLLTDAPRSLL